MYLGNKRLVENLLDKRVDTNKATKDGVTPLFLAARKGEQP